MNLFDKLYLKIVFEQAPMDPCSDKELEDKLIGAKYRIFSEYPFFGQILSNFRLICTTQLPTFAISNQGDLYYNPAFATQLSFKQLIGVLCHEVMHIAMLSLFRLGTRDRELWNIATDLTINWDLIQDNFDLPAKGLIPDKDGIYDVGKMGGTFKRFKIDVKDKSAEELYDELTAKVDEKLKKFLNDLAQELDKHIYDAPPPSQKGQQPPNEQEDQGPQVGDLVYNEDTGEFGEVIKVGKDDVTVTMLTEDQAKKKIARDMGGINIQLPGGKTLGT